AEELERLFMRWVRYVGGLKHSTFHHAPLARAFPSYSLVVDKDPAAGDFTSVQAAVDSLPTINLVRVVIKVNAGTYTEKVTISSMRAFITLEGAGADKTIVQWGDTADTPAGPRGRPLGTYGSASFAVNAQYFIARNITFKNTAPVPPAGATGKQAVALRVSADNAAFVGCRFLGAQDTLYDQSGRHYYKDCYIEGSIDFIFGNALSLYEGCHVHAIARDYGALTAQNRQSMLEDTGFSFVGCRVTGSGALYLGRAWGTFSRVVFAYTYMDDIIVPRGWYNWGDPSRELYALSLFLSFPPSPSSPLFRFLTVDDDDDGGAGRCSTGSTSARAPARATPAGCRGRGSSPTRRPSPSSPSASSTAPSGSGSDRGRVPCSNTHTRAAHTSSCKEEGVERQSG
uniref:Pectinesterase n=1 Tax=Aegilops tauschii subsp. strangulata TaxID=200361 RepID=A0A453AMY2_AEGTS